jgi:curved DNA-binding protein CbpA
MERQLSGTFELTTGAESAATLVCVSGFPAKVRTTAPVHYLGEVLLDLGLVTDEHLKASLEALQVTPRLQGQILHEMGAIDEEGLEAGLRTQVERKMEHLFTLPGETVFSYFDGVDVLAKYGGAPTPIDPLPVLWRGVRSAPAWEHVDATLRRVGPAGLRLAPNAQIERIGFDENEAQAVELMRQRHARVVDLQASQLVDNHVAQLLIYFLVITKQVDLLETASMMPRPPMPAPPPMPPPSGQSLGRVQLAARTIQKKKLVVEEHVDVPADDERVSSPGMQSPKAPEIGVPQGGLDIGSLITNTIASSLPPPAPAAMTVPAIPPPPAVGAGPSPSAGAIPAAAPSQPRQLTAEQSSLKQKILERAEQITSQNYYQMLGLGVDAPPEAVQKAFFALAKVWHPDRLPPALVDVKDACSKVFAHLTEANAVLSDEVKRKEYVQLMKDGGATPDDQAKIQTILEAATEFQKAEILLKRNLHDVQAYELVRRAVSLDPEQADYMALLTWLDSHKPEWLGREKTLEKIGVLDRCIKKNPHSSRAFFYRGMLYKRIDEGSKAVKDFRKVVELDPRNLDAQREVRLHTMRGGTKPPPGPGGSPGGPRPGGKPPPASETLGGLFGKLFKK